MTKEQCETILRRLERLDSDEEVASEDKADLFDFYNSHWSDILLGFKAALNAHKALLERIEQVTRC